MSDRIRGEDVVIVVTVNGQTQVQLTNISSMEFQEYFETKQKGFLGKTTDEFDDVYHGAGGNLELQHDTAKVFDFVKAVRDRARRKTPGVVVNILATFQYPNGERKRVVCKDAKFGNIPFNFPERGEYGTLKLEYRCSLPDYV